MKFIDILRMAFGNLKRNKMRTVLTVSGVVVGIGAIVFLVSLGYGLQELMVSKVAKLEALTVITVRPGNKDNTTITEDSIKKFKSYGEVTDVSPLLRSPAQIAEKNATSETVVYGIEPKYWEMEDIKIDNGSKFSGPEAKEAIVSVASLKGLNLSNTSDVVGKTLNFKIVQLDASGKTKTGHENDILGLKVVGLTNDDKVKYAYVPIEVVKKVGVEEYGQVKIKVAGRNQVNAVRKAVESIGFQTSSVKDTVDQIDQAFVIIRGVLGGFGMIALFVAAIGIFNTMTISLLERTLKSGL
jgi:putative ABC transport system permease protein